LFLEAILARNPGLVSTAFSLHSRQAIPPNCFVIDLEAVAANARILSQAAARHGLSLYFTTKQLGFNPLVARTVSQAGIPKAIAIDFREAAVLSQHHVPIGHIGHLVQIPNQMLKPVLQLDPEVVTVFSVEKARQISDALDGAGKQVRLLLRVVSEGDYFFPGQEGGLPLERLVEDAAAIQKLPNLRIAGVTTYPCLQLEEGSQTVHAAPNFHTIRQAAEILHKELGVEIEQINAPGNTCVASIPLLAELGATHGEPGHALTGTTYLHTQLHQAEMPALVYVSEVSHLHNGKAYIFGGGTRMRARIHKALVATTSNGWVKAEVEPIDASAIDYYLGLHLTNGHNIQVGDSVILASRAQIFVSRAYVAVVNGIQSGKPEFMGLFDAWGRAIDHIL
jgi:predicted amino acid racemase